MNVRLRSTSLILAASTTLMACGASPDAGDVESAQGDGDSVAETPVASASPTTTPPGLTELARVELSDTHRVIFYEDEAGQGAYTETFNLDADTGPVVDREAARDLTLAEVYDLVAQDESDSDTRATLAAVDERSVTFQAAETLSVSPRLESPGLEISPAEQGLIEKDFDSDNVWFTQTFCGGCNGGGGTTYPWMPLGPLCTTTPDYCLTGISTPYGQKKKSKNLSFVVANLAFSGTTLAEGYYSDPCENESWFWNLTHVCTKGARMFYIDVEPRTYVGHSSTSSSSWTREWKVSGAFPVSVMADYY